MQFSFSEEQRMFRDSLREFLARECAPALVRAVWDKGGQVPGLWGKLAELGVVGLTGPQEAGGLGLSELDLVLLLEETGRAAMPEPIVEHTAVALPALASMAGNARHAQLLADAVSGSARLAVVLDCTPYAHGAAQAQALLLQREDSIHLLEIDQVTFQGQRSVDGSRDLAAVQWRPTSESRLARGTEALEQLQLARDRGALGTAAQLLGLAQQMLDVTVEYVKTRQQFGQPLGSFQAIKHKLADTITAIEMARPVVYRAAHSLSAGAGAVYGPGDASVHVSMAKVFAGDAASLAARSALQCHGAIGYSYEHDLHIWMKRTWALTRTWGDTAWHRDHVGRRMVDVSGGAA